MMVAEKAADLILGATPLPAEQVEFYRHGVLRSLISPPGPVPPELLAMAWGMDFDPQTNLVDGHVGYLRQQDRRNR
mgnify:CR=1 FL=1